MDDQPERTISTRAEFHDEVRSAFEEAATHGCRQIWLSDTDFSDWPLGEKSVVESLTRWAQSHRRLLLVAQNYDEFARRHSRWVEWRRTWSHVVMCRAVADLEPGQMPTAMLCVGRRGIRLADPVRYRGITASDAVSLAAIGEQIDAMAQRSEEAFPVTMLGL